MVLDGRLGRPRSSRALVAVTAGLALCVPLAAPAAAAHPGSRAREAHRVQQRDGRIAFGRVDPTHPGSGATFGLSFSLWVADAQGRHQRRLTQDSTGFSDWSPDGRRIAFDHTDDAGDVHIAVVRADGTGRRELTTAAGIQEVPRWSPDGRHLAYDAYDPSQATFSTSLWVVRADGTQPRRVTRDGFDVEPDYAPDGRHLAFGRIVDDATGAVALSTVRTDGRRLREVVPATRGLEHADWSPDGRLILFDIDPGAQPGRGLLAGSVYSVRPDGRHLRLLVRATEHVGFFKPRWSPSGRRLLLGCSDDRVGRDRLCTSRADGSHVRVVPLGGDQVINFPAWGPRPHRVR